MDEALGCLGEGSLSVFFFKATKAYKVWSKFMEVKSSRGSTVGF